ncbi:MAG: long-chain acyl-CoA synthetase [Verrucomicrobiales bacterium]
MTLYEHWLKVVAATPHAIALTETSSARNWTFAELQREAEQAESPKNRLREARGRGADFVITTLVAWRDDAVLCPCERNEILPEISTPPVEACHVKHTSGSTGTPRAVWFTPEQLRADVDHIVMTMGLRPTWPNIGVISLSHSYGFSNLVLPLLLHGIPLILVADVLPGTVERSIGNHDAVTLAAVPAMWRAWLGTGILNERIRLAISAGAPLTLALEQAAYDQSGLKIHNFYGSTECGGIAYDRTEIPRTDGAYVGHAMDGVTLGIVEERLQVRSPAVALGYADDPNFSTLRDGHFLTTDHAEIEAAGGVCLRGRHGESINVAGRKVSPQSIEEILFSVHGIQHVVIFGVPSQDPERVDDIVCALHLSEGGSLNEVKATATKRLPSWQRPRHWWACETLKPDARGKISRHAWRQRYLHRD